MCTELLCMAVWVAAAAYVRAVRAADSGLEQHRVFFIWHMGVVGEASVRGTLLLLLLALPQQRTLRVLSCCMGSGSCGCGVTIIGQGSVREHHSQLSLPSVAVVAAASAS